MPEMKRLRFQNVLQEAIPLLLWLGFVLMPFLLRSPSMPSYVRKHFLENIFWSNLLLLSVFYLHAYVIYPFTKKKNGIWWYSLSLAGCLAVFLYISFSLLPETIPPGGPRNPGEHVEPLSSRNTGGNDALVPPPANFRDPARRPPDHRAFKILPFFFVVFCSYSYCILRDNTKREKALTEKETEHLKTELKFLRSQISPHFMFNVLNSMVSLARKQSPMLEISLINMSNLMRYMLYESNGKLVSLTTEVDYLRDYIDLQLLRYGDTVKLNFYLSGRTEGYNIEPMLLIPFVENAFKHGIFMIDGPIIDISLSISESDPSGQLVFSVVNSISPEGEKSEDGMGIGLSNIKRRLTLLYPGKHQLTIDKNNDIFRTELHIKLT